MAYSTITKPGDYFNTVLYSGTGATNSVTGVGFQPDFLWLKSRNNGGGAAGNHRVYDVVRGVDGQYYILHPNLTNAENTSTTNEVSSLDSDGFTIGSGTEPNASGGNYVAWNWLAGGTAVSNTDGSITSSVSANTTSGFSIVSYTGTGANATIGHGLGVAPKMVIVKNRSIVDNWTVGNTNIGWTKYLYLNSTAAEATDSLHWQDTAPTSSVFSVGTRNRVNGSGHNMIAFCFAEVKGFSKFGKYTGNGSTDGTFVYTGFRPAWVMIKRTDSTGDWILRDNKMKTFNVRDNYLLPSSSGAEVTSAPNNKIDLLSNGFKQRSPSTGTVENASGGSYIYMAFAENPLVANTGGGIPATAR